MLSVNLNFPTIARDKKQQLAEGGNYFHIILP